MPELNILCGAQFHDRDLQLLRTGIAPHHLLSGDSPSATLDQADVILGQPEVESVLGTQRLRWLHITSAGFTRYDTPEFRAAAKARGLIVTNSSAVYAEACAEHLLAFMLTQARQLAGAIGNEETDSDQAGHWRGACVCLRNQSAVILGYGSIASRLVELLAPFQMKVTALRRQPRGDEPVSIVTPENLAAALAVADHVINILPFNADSLHFISAQRLAQTKRGAIFYNIGRGQTVDQQALADSLQSGHLGAVWLDVTDPEPLPRDHPLRTSPRCYITPHIAGGHANESETSIRHFLDNLQRFLHGSPLQDRIM
jgi:phosphoglycerate dehydrogenase-like enzyme